MADDAGSLVERVTGVADNADGLVAAIVCVLVSFLPIHPAETAPKPMTATIRPPRRAAKRVFRNDLGEGLLSIAGI